MAPKKKTAPEAPEYSVAVQKGTLARALAQVGRIKSPRSALPILNNVLLDAANGQLRLTMTNLAISITQIIGAEVRAPMQITVPVTTLADSLRGLPDDTIVHLSRVEKGEKLAYFVLPPFKRQANVLAISADEFPQGTYYPDIHEDALSLPGALVASTFDNVESAIARDEARPNLTCLHFALDDRGRLRVEATDGFRLHIDTISTQITGRAVDVLIPLAAIQEVVKLIDKDAPVLIDFVRQGEAHNIAVFNQEAWQMTALLMDGKFPDLSAVIPAKSALQITTPWEGLTKALLGGEVYAKEVSHTGHFKFSAGGEEAPGSLTVSVKSAESGNLDAELDAAVSGAERFEFACNTSYLKDALDALSEGQVTLDLTSATSPIVIREGGFVAVLMPMHFGK